MLTQRTDHPVYSCATRPMFSESGKENRQRLHGEAPSLPRRERSPSLPAGEDGAGNVVALTFSFAFPDLFYLGFLAVDGRTRSAGYGTRILTHFRERYGDVPQLLEIEPVVREAGNYQQRVRRLAFYERNGFEVTNMLTHEADQTYRVLARDGIVSPQRLEEALNSVTDDPAYASRVTTD